MKNSILILLLMACFSGYCQDTICLPKKNYLEVYKGLKRAEQLKKVNEKYLKDINSLYDIIKEQNDTLNSQLDKLDEVNKKYDKLNEPYPFYKRWWFIGTIGLLTGKLLL